MWDLSGPGIEPVTPALAGGFLTTAQPGKSPNLLLNKSNVVLYLLSSCSFKDLDYILKEKEIIGCDNRIENYHQVV